MDLASTLAAGGRILMEGVLGERLKREYHLPFDAQVAMAALVYTAPGRQALTALWSQYAQVARLHGVPFLAATPTRRANRERVMSSPYGSAIIRDNVRFLQTVAGDCGIPVFCGGLMGCRGDAYSPSGALSVTEARTFYRWQASLFKEAGAGFLLAGIMPALTEAVGMAQAMADSGLPYPP